MIIHIGLHKTASTFLQKEYFPSLTNVICPRNNNFYPSLMKGINTLDSRILLSYEGFSGLPWNDARKIKVDKKISWLEEFEQNIKFLAKEFPYSSIIVFFRPHGEFLVSLYKQFLHEGGTLKIEEFYNSNGIIGSSDLSYSKRIEFLKNSFTSVFCLDYLDFKLYGLTFLDEFFEKEMNIKREVKEFTVKKHNKSISDNKIEPLRQLNNYYNKLPNQIRNKSIFKALNPRNLMQKSTLIFKEQDSQSLKLFKMEIDESFKEDWETFLGEKWIYKPKS